MKSLLIALSFALCLTGCYRASQESRLSTASVVDTPKEQKAGDTNGLFQLKRVSLDQVNQAETTAAAFERKILKNAEVTMEVGSPVEAQRKVSLIAGNRGGFVVTSESKQRDTNDPNNRELDIAQVIRVPSSQFESSLEEIRGIGTRILQDKESGQDVTEEFIDLEARIKTQKALEAQFLEIMRQAVKVPDALEVQRQIAEVRTEIEKLEGRKRFLDNRSSLSTITINLQSLRPIIASTSGFGQTLKDSVSDGVAVATGIVIFLIRFTIIMIPVFFLLLLPGGILIRYLLRRAKRLQLARNLETVPES
jgi:hypothetical protein